MKKYIKPQIYIDDIELNDVIMVSLSENTNGGFVEIDFPDFTAN